MLSLHPLRVAVRRYARDRAPRRAREPRGVILIFVVVLLTLLAIMGTAYLTVARADRTALTGRGGAAYAGPELLADRGLIDALFDKTAGTVQQLLLEDLYDVGTNAPADGPAIGPKNAPNTYLDPTDTAFRPPSAPGTTDYEDYDSFGKDADDRFTDPWLAAALPSWDVNTDGPMWSKLSLPLQFWTVTPPPPGVDQVRLTPRFYDPREIAVGGPLGTPIEPTGFTPADHDARDVLIAPDGVALEPLDANVIGLERRRLYPGLIDANNDPKIAGDADGDGMADCFLQAVELRPTQGTLAAKVIDQANGRVAYFVGYKVVDNSSRVNVGTAFSVNDYNIDGSAGVVPSIDQIGNRAVPAGALLPNKGFFRGNVGLVELLWPMRAAGGFPVQWGAGAGGTANAAQEASALFDVRLGRNGTSQDDQPTLPLPDVQTVIVDENGAGAEIDPPTGGQTVALYGSFADLFDGAQRSAIATGPANPGGSFVLLDASAGEVRPFGKLSNTEAVGLAYRGGGLLHEGGNTAQANDLLESNLKSVFQGAVNYNPDAGSVWGYWPPNKPYHWFACSFDFLGESAGGDAVAAGVTPSAGLHTDPNTAGFDGANTYAFEGDRFARSPRALLTALSGVTRNAGAVEPTVGAFDNTVFGALVSADGEHVAKASVATATFEQLRSAFYHLLGHAEQSGNAWPLISTHRAAAATTADLFGATVAQREASMRALRATVAACNAIDLRDPDAEVWDNNADPVAGAGPRVVAFGNERQPFVTEVIVDFDATGACTYVAVELYNPYADELVLEMPTAGSPDVYRLAVVERTGNSNATFVQLGSTLPITASGGVKIEPGAYVVLTEGTIPVAPADPVTPVNTANAVEVPTAGLIGAFGSGNDTAKERSVLLLRTRRPDGALITGGLGAVTTAYNYDDAENLDDFRSLVPVECLDVRDVVFSTVGTPQRYRMVRPSNAVAGDSWRCVWGGDRKNATTGQYFGAFEDDLSTYAGTLGLPETVAALGVVTTEVGATTGPTASLGFVPQVQVSNFDVKLADYPADKFPFGSPLARDADVLAVPFVGSYYVRNAAGDTLEIGALPADVSMAEGPGITSNASDPGRFVPDSDVPAENWRERATEYLSAHHGSASLLPAVPADRPLSGATNDVLFTVADALPTAGPLDKGRINVNTAPEAVLCMLPLGLKLDDGTYDPEATRTFAKRIIIDRALAPSPADFEGPFTSVLNFATRYTDPLVTAETSPVSGDQVVPIPGASDFTNSAADGGDLSPDLFAEGDFDDRLSGPARLSNLISTRSDTYTVYITVQAWSGVGLPASAGAPRLVAERRGAFIVDRSHTKGADKPPRSIGELLVTPVDATQ